LHQVAGSSGYFLPHGELIVQIDFGNIRVGLDEIKFFCHRYLPNNFMEMVIKDTKYTLSALKKYYVMNGNDTVCNKSLR
jgi:hypothetical protein